MIIIEDTNQKVGHHDQKHKQWKKRGDKVVRCRLPVGDYCVMPILFIDTKNGLEEIAMNLCGSDKERERFLAEQLRAKEWNSRLLILIEDDRITTFDDIKGTKIMHPSGWIIDGDTLYDRIIESMELGTEYIIAAPNESAKVISEILGAEQHHYI